MSYVVPLSTLDEHDRDVGGAKAVNLGIMLQHGFPIPDGFVVTTHAYRHHLSVCEVSPDWTAERVRTCLYETELSETLGAEVHEAHQTISCSNEQEMVYAVRSSATAEDTAGASFAGQHATYYYVREAQLLAMIKACWVSLWNDPAVSYRQSQGLDNQAVEMAVIVQRMIPSHVSGVMFTENPVSGNTRELVIESSWGMGASIVDGRVSPDRFVIDRDSGRIHERVIGDKRYLVPWDLQSADQQRMLEVSPERRRMVTLSDQEIGSLMRWGQAAETCFGKPQDIEWAIADGELFILQSRPITTTSAGPDLSSIKGKYVLFKRYN